MFPSVARLQPLNLGTVTDNSNLLFATGAKDKGERSGLVRGVLVALLAAAVGLFYSVVSFSTYFEHILCPGAGNFPTAFSVNSQFFRINTVQLSKAK